MKKIIAIIISTLFLMPSVQAGGLHSAFEKAIQNGRANNGRGAYTVQFPSRKNIMEEKVLQYMQSKNYILTKDYVTKKMIRFGYFTQAIDHVEFIPQNELESYIANTPLANNVGKAVIFPYFKKETVDVYWSGSVNNGFIQGNGVGYTKLNKTMYIIKGSFDNGIPTGSCEVVTATPSFATYPRKLQNIDKHTDNYTVGSSSNGHRSVQMNGKFGFINEKGDIIVECKYRNVQDAETALVSGPDKDPKEGGHANHAAINLTEKEVNNAVKKGRYTVRKPFAPYTEHIYSVSNCEIPESDFNSFFNNYPDFKIKGDPIKKVISHNGSSSTYITSFSFWTKEPETYTLEYGLQMANNDYTLRLPAFDDIQTANVFFLKYVKPHPKWVDKYLSKFANAYTAYLNGNKDRVKKFCLQSPYNEEIFDLPHPKYKKTERRIPVRSVLNSVLSTEDLVFYLKDGYGYIYNNKGRYLGDIVNGKAHGKGEWEPIDNAESKWIGEFRNGKMNGPITHILEMHNYNGYYSEDKRNRFKQEEKGNCVDGVWDGDVEITVENRSFSLSSRDVTKIHYNKGVPTKREVLDSSLIDGLKSHISSQNDIEKDFKSGNLRIPRIKKTYDWGEHGISVVFEDGTRILNIAVSSDGDYTIWDDYGFYSEKDFEKAVKSAYLLDKYNHSNTMNFILKYGLPAWK